MGAGGSVPESESRDAALRWHIIDGELKKPLNASDVDTPRGISAKEEVMRLRALIASSVRQEKAKLFGLMGSAPSIQEYFRSVFAQSDKDHNGTLSREEFWTMIDSLDLGLSPKEISKLQNLTDQNKDNNISLAEFIEAAPGYFKKAADEAALVMPWMQLEDPTGQVFYYNKKTFQSVYDPPAELLNNLTELAEQGEKNLLPDLKQYIRETFAAADKDGSGGLTSDEFFDLLLNQLNLGLTEERFLLLQERFDMNNDGLVKWEEFVFVLPNLLKQLNQEEDEAKCWFKQSSKVRRSFFVNTKTGTTTWTMPPTFEEIS